MTSTRKISTDYGFGESPVTRELLKPKSCLARSKSASVGDLPSPDLPRVTLNDFSALTINPMEEMRDFQSSDFCVTLEDVRSAKARNSRLLKKQSFEFDTWSCTNSSIGNSLDELPSESEREDVLDSKLERKVGKKCLKSLCFYGVDAVRIKGIYGQDFCDVLGI